MDDTDALLRAHSDVSLQAFRAIRDQQDAMDERMGLAHTMHEALTKVIRDFQSHLAADQEVGACLTNFGNRVTISITSLGYQYPHLMVFYGIDPDGKEVQLVQHTSQVNLMLVPVPATSQPARRIGFETGADSTT